MTLNSNRLINNINREGINMAPSNNDTNQDHKRKISLIEVEMMADKLCLMLNNPGFKEWYCKAIHTLGADRIDELLGRTEGSKYAGKLFSTLANEEMRRVQMKKRIDKMKK